MFKIKYKIKISFSWLGAVCNGRISLFYHLKVSNLHLNLIFFLKCLVGESLSASIVVSWEARTSKLTGRATSHSKKHRGVLYAVTKPWFDFILHHLFSILNYLYQLVNITFFHEPMIMSTRVLMLGMKVLIVCLSAATVRESTDAA